MHSAGIEKSAPNRITLSPLKSTLDDVNHLCKNIIPEQYQASYKRTAQKIIDISAPLFENLTMHRIHGDCHGGNILNRAEEGLLLIDFDDMAMGPAVQDLWLLLPDRANNAGYEIELFIEGYERFRRFDRKSLTCIEPLRAMRMIYFLAWASRQADDFQFKKHFPTWGNDSFWQREISDLEEQLLFIVETTETTNEDDY
jgi:Ser/Thr protein kinase RdoA (MazF antagonist)